VNTYLNILGIVVIGALAAAVVTGCVAVIALIIHGVRKVLR
jgi:hypothetical protein